MPLPQQEVVSMGAPRIVEPGRRVVGMNNPTIGHHKSVQVKNPIIWEKSSFSLRRASKYLWELSCEFCSEMPCELAVHFHCSERLDGQTQSLEYTSADVAAPQSIFQSYPEGKHAVRLEGDTVIDLKRWPLEVFWKITKKDPQIIPIVMSLRAGNVQSVVHMTLQQERSRSAGGAELSCQMLRQKVCVDGHEYSLQEVYGIEALAAQGNHDESAVGEPCVICLTDPRNTAVLPCRHLCVCQDCATQLQIGAATRMDRCPVCRGNITGMEVFEVAR